MKILAISGSLRQSSSNTTILRAAASLVPAGVAMNIYDGLGELPHFNPDAEATASPSVREFQARLDAADVVVICSPEYAHGVPGVLKNALDWVVGSGELMDKPVALFGGSPRSIYVQASLKETLTVMSARLIPEACVTLALSGRSVTEADILSDPEFAPALRAGLEALLSAAEDKGKEGSQMVSAGR